MQSADGLRLNRHLRLWLSRLRADTDTDAVHRAIAIEMQTMYEIELLARQTLTQMGDNRFLWPDECRPLFEYLLRHTKVAEKDELSF